METKAWEGSSLVSRIPAEILANIFIRIISFLPAQRGHHCRLFNTLFVCWRWHDIAVSTPYLWCHLGSNINLWPLFARRSKSLDLFIHMYDITGEYRMVAREEFDTMFKDPGFHQRIREITFDGDPETFIRLFDNAPILPPRLTSLTLTNGFAPFSTPRTPAGFVAPCLEKLEIVDLCFDLDTIAGTRNLTHLSMTMYKDCFPNSAKLLSVLRENTRLEYFRFISKFESSLEDGSSRIPLPHLRILDVKFHWTKFRISRFLELLELSANIEEIKLATSFRERHDNLAWVLGTVYPAIPPDRLHHLVVRESSSQNTAFHYRKFPSADVSFLQTAPVLMLKSDDILKSPTHGRLKELEQYSILSNLTHLEIKIFQWKPRLRPVFEMTKALEKLTVWTWKHCRELFDVLSPAIAGSDTDGAGDAEGTNSTGPAGVRLLLPALGELTIIEADLSKFDQDTSPISCFRARDQHGSRLETLKFLVCSYFDPDWVEELEGFVQEVFWDELEVDTSSDDETESSESEQAGTTDDSGEEDYFLYGHRSPSP